MSSYIPFRLRVPKDDDIKNWIAEELELAAARDQEMDRSDVIRAALRFYFKHRNSFPSSVVTGTGVLPTLPPQHDHESPSQGTERQADPQRAPSRAFGKPLLKTGIKKDGKA